MFKNILWGVTLLFVSLVSFLAGFLALLSIFHFLSEY